MLLLSARLAVDLSSSRRQGKRSAAAKPKDAGMNAIDFGSAVFPTCRYSCAVVTCKHLLTRHMLRQTQRKRKRG